MNIGTLSRWGLNRFVYMVVKTDILLAVRLNESRFSSIFSICNTWTMFEVHSRYEESPSSATNIADDLTSTSSLQSFYSSFDPNSFPLTAISAISHMKLSSRQLDFHRTFKFSLYIRYLA